MKLLLTFAACLCAIVANAANPSTKSFRGTGGIGIVSNDTTGLIIIDGSGISGGSATNAQPPNASLSNLAANAFTTISNANLLFVDAGGNDTTAKRGRRDKPWLTPVAAKAAAAAGDTIVVFPGQYNNATNLLKQGVNWIGYGAWLTYTNVTNDAGTGIFDDRFSGAVTSSISGFNFRYSCGYETTNAAHEPAFGPTNVLGCIVQTNRFSELDIRFGRIEFQNVRQTQGAAALALFNGTNTYIAGDSIIDLNLTRYHVIGYDPDAMEDVVVGSVASGVYWEAGEHHVAVKRIEVKLYSIYTQSLPTNVIGNFWFSGDYCLGKFYSAGQSITGEWKSWIDLKEIRTCPTNSGASGTINTIGTGKFYFRIEKIDSDGMAVVATGDNTVWLDCQKVSATTKWIDVTAGARVYANVQEFVDLGAVDGGFDIDGGFLELNGKTATVTNATGSAVFFNSGTASISNLRLSTLNSTNSPVLVATNGLVLQNCTLLAKSTAFSVLATSAKSVNLQGCWGNTPETNNISYLVGPWTVDSNVR